MDLFKLHIKTIENAFLPQGQCRLMQVLLETNLTEPSENDNTTLMQSKNLAIKLKEEHEEVILSKRQSLENENRKP